MKSLTAQESEEMFTLMLTGKMPERDIEDFLVCLRDKGESTDEILGAARAMRKLTLPLTPSPNGRGNSLTPSGEILDVCGTGGDGLKTLNISTAVALVVAACGVKVAKHGNKAISSASGSSDVLSELGILSDNSKLQTANCSVHSSQFTDCNFIYLHAPDYHIGMKYVSAVRARLKTRTIFNLLGPLCNPAQAQRQLIGVYDAALLRPFAEVLRELGSKKAWVVHGAGGLDEISLSGATQVAELDKGAIDMFEVTPADFGFERKPLAAIAGGDAKYNAAEMRALFDGKKSAYRDIVLMNAAAALLVAEKVGDLKSGVKIAAEAIDSGAVEKNLYKLTTNN